MNTLLLSTSEEDIRNVHVSGEEMLFGRPVKKQEPKDDLFEE